MSLPPIAAASSSAEHAQRRGVVGRRRLLHTVEEGRIVLMAELLLCHLRRAVVPSLPQLLFPSHSRLQRLRVVRGAAGSLELLAGVGVDVAHC